MRDFLQKWAKGLLYTFILSAGDQFLFLHFPAIVPVTRGKAEKSFFFFSAGKNFDPLSR